MDKIAILKPRSLVLTGNPQEALIVICNNTGHKIMNILLRTFTAFLGGLAIFFVTFAVLSGGHHYQYADRIYPGVSVGGVDLSGLTVPQAETRLRNELRYSTDGRIAFSTATNSGSDQSDSAFWVSSANSPN